MKHSFSNKTPHEREFARSLFLFIWHVYILYELPSGDFYAGKYSRAHHFAAIEQCCL
jgi:hypothetical protein